MKISIKDYLMAIIILIFIFIGLFLLQQNKYYNEKNILIKKYCLDNFISEMDKVSDERINYLNGVRDCNSY